MPLIRAVQLGKRVPSPNGELRILEDVTLSVAPGESLAVTGVSGSGKSTLLGLLAGLDQPSGGRVLWGEQDLADLDEEGRAQLRSGQVGFVFQSFHLLEGLTVLENVLLPLELCRVPDALQGAQHATAQVGLSPRAGHYPRQLSGGERQRVAIARAIAAQPPVLFADEPTGNLDQGNTERIADLLFAAQAEQRNTLVLVTHDAALAARCDRSISLDNGRLTPR